VLRFDDHGGAALVYKSGKCRGNCVETVLDSSWGAVGILINGAQRAGDGRLILVDLGFVDG
jgi:hypothetical protein